MISPFDFWIWFFAREKVKPCSECKGNQNNENCPICKGMGNLRVIKCEKCKGLGQFVSSGTVISCDVCDGKGEIFFPEYKESSSVVFVCSSN